LLPGQIITAKPYKTAMQRLNPPLDIRCHLVEQTILLKCHYVFARRKRIKQILAYVYGSAYTSEGTIARTAVVSGIANNPTAGRADAES
jgi:hypothetical protein